MNKNIVLDDLTISRLFSQIETLIESSRAQMSTITSKYSTLDTYQDLVQNKDLIKLYGNTADDYSKLCFLQQGIVEAIMDIKSVKRGITDDASGVIPSMIRSYKYRADNIIDALNDLKDATAVARQGMEARVRYLSTTTYSSFDKFKGAQC